MKSLIWPAVAAACLPAAAFADDLPAFLESAVASIEANLPSPETRFAFTRTLESAKGVFIVTRFDPSQTEDNGWSLVEPAEGELSADEQKALDQLRGETDTEAPPDRDLFIQQPRDTVVGCAETESQLSGVVLYSCEPPLNDDEIEGFREVLSAEIGVDASSGQLVSYRMYASEPFKPATVAKIETMDMMMEFSPAWEDGPVMVKRATQSIKGSAMFRRFEEDVTVTYSDITPAP